MSGAARNAWLAMAAAVAVVALIVGLLSLHRPLSSVPADHGAAASATAPRARFARPAPIGAAGLGDAGRNERTASPRLDAPPPAGDLLGVAWSVLRWPLLAAGLAACAILAARTRARRERIMQRVLIIPGRSSEASPAQVAGLIEALTRITRERWWVRLVRGSPPAVTLELISGSTPGGAAEQRIGIAVPRAEGSLEALRGALASRYPDAEIAAVEEEAREELRRWLGEVVRLKKAKHFARALDRPLERSLASTEPYQEAAIDAVLAVMAEVGERVLVQITISPVPDRFQRTARSFSVQRRDPAREAPAPDAVQQREERSSTEAVVFRPLSFCDIRVGAETYRAARQVAGAIEGQALGGENELRQRRPLLRRALYIERLVRAESNPLPSWWRGVYSSLEIAGLWQIPTAHTKNVAVERSSVPQLATPPEVYRPNEERKAIATDLRGNYVGVRAEDWKYGFQVSGAAGGGKTSVLARVGAVRATEPNTALVVLDPKGELAEAIAATVPAWRTVRFLDVARPLFGLALETPDRDLTVEAEIFSEAMVDVSRTEEGDSQALNASQRSFKMARGATLALEVEPTFWHTARWLASDDDAAEWRAKKIAKLAGDSKWHAVWDHFARILPAQLQKSPSQAVMRLEAPYNKIQTLLGDERLNAVLHHPVTVSLAEMIRKRELLLIAGRAGDHPDALVFLKFAVQVLHRAILAQQALPEEERARVAAIIDDAGNLFTPTIARMMENDRSAGLDLALGWQHGGQMTPELAEAVDALCNSRVYLRSAEQDALRAVNRLNPAYEARVSGGLGDLKRTRVEVNQLTGLELKHGVAVLQAGERLSSSFTVKTIPWTRDPRKLAEFDARVRAEGGYDPEVIAPPRELTGRGENEDVRDVGGEEASEPSGEKAAGKAAIPPEAGAADAGPPGPAPPPETPAPTRPGPAPSRAAGPEQSPARAEERKARPPRRGRRQADVAPLGTPTDKALSAGYGEVELMREQAAGISWEKPGAEPSELRHKTINAEQRAILEALYELRVLSAGQIQREFLVSAGERQVRRELSLLVRRRMIRRGELGLRKTRGRGKRFYALDEEGFALLRDAPDHPASGSWRAPELNSSQHVVHDLARNEWLWGFRALAPRQLAGWRGPRTGKIELPLVKEGRGPARPLVPRDLRENAPIDFAGEEFANFVPDLTLELVLRRPNGQNVETDLLVEIEWGNNEETVRRKAIAYDGFLTGWWRAHPRYKALGRPPIVFFVVSDTKRAARFVELLDETLTSYLLGPAETQTREQHRQGVTPEAKTLRLGRRNVFVAVARDISQRTLRAWRVPAEPPAERIRAARNAQERRRAGKSVPRPFMLIDPREQVDPAR
ncbi:MAG: replication-relaxation family protein [Actinobacteria bacterium]|nr:replication-relaxation family protein [Actinomycetota bacterium]